MKKLFFLASALLCGAISASAARVYVQTGEEGDPTWTITLGEKDKLVNLNKEGVKALPKTGLKEFWFAAGTYKIDTTFMLEQYDATFMGGFAGTETDASQRVMKDGGKPWEFANPTILDGGNAVRLINDASRRPNFDGLTLQNFKSTANGGVFQIRNGANLKQTVKNCQFLNDSAANQGGAIQVYSGNALIEGCYFAHNGASQGGAIYANNTMGITIKNCTFEGNTAVIASNAGGAIHVQNSGNDTIVGCTFIGNDAPNGQGGALSLANSGTATFAANNVFANNSGKQSIILLTGTQGFYYNTVYNCTGKAIYVAGNATVKNNVFWGETADNAVFEVKADITPTYTNNAGLKWAEGADASNIVLEPANTGSEEGKLYPVFADPENGDFNLGKGSALIGKGVVIEGITTDIEGVTRTSLDLGAYAYVEGKVPTAVENTEKAPIDIQAALQAGEVYNLLGQRVGELQAGNIYIVGGQKVLMR